MPEDRNSGNGGSDGNGGGGDGDGDGDGAFGNRDGGITAGDLEVFEGDAGVDCEIGERCAATQPDDDCGSLTLEGRNVSTEIPGNILVVFDRSGSMDSDWGGQRRYIVAGQALVAAVTPLADKLTMGAILFPSGDGGGGILGGGGSCDVTSITAPDQINFMPAAGFINALPNFWTPPSGARTPLEAAMARADEALSTATLVGNVAVVVITDGEPNCDTVDATVLAYADRFLSRGTKTYVIGLPGSGGLQVLQDLAAHGGTVDYIEPTDAATLEMRLGEIVGESVTTGFDSCNITIDPPAEVPEELHLVVTLVGGQQRDVPHDLGNGAGWTISNDGSQVQLTGVFCDDAQSGAVENIRFEFGCVDLPVLPPPPPPVID